MIKFCSENKNCLTPNFATGALQGIQHRFVLVLECETRMYNDATKGERIAPPRFAIGGSRATIDPRNASVAELYPLASHKLEIPPGWEKIHQYIYVLQPTTDEHGWQYRSEWSNGPIGEEDEPWVKVNAEGLDVRRRLWMTTVVKRDDVVNAKRKLAEALQTKPRGMIMEGELFRQEQGIMKSWQKRYVYLTDNTLEFYAGGGKDNGGKKVGEVSISECEVKMLFGVQCPGREFAFSIRKNNELVCLLDAESREIRRRWVVAISYQLALLSPEINFSPFDYGPQTGEEASKRVLMCGDLQKQGHVIRNWKKRFFQLNPRELQYYDKEQLKGSMPILGAMLTPGTDSSTDFSLRSELGKVLVMRADNVTTKATWIRALSRQIHRLQEQEKLKQAAPSSTEGEEVVTEEVKEAAKIEAEAEDAEWHQKGDESQAQHHSPHLVEPISPSSAEGSSTKGLGLGFDEDASTAHSSADSSKGAEEPEEDEDDEDPTEAKIVAANLLLRAYIHQDKEAFVGVAAEELRLVVEAFDVDAQSRDTAWAACTNEIASLLKMPEGGGGLMDPTFPEPSTITGSLPIASSPDDSLIVFVKISLNESNQVIYFGIENIPEEALPKEPEPEPEPAEVVDSPAATSKQPYVAPTGRPTSWIKEKPAASEEGTAVDEAGPASSNAGTAHVAAVASADEGETAEHAGGGKTGAEVAAAGSAKPKHTPVTERFKGFAPTQVAPAVPLRTEKVERLVRRRDSVVGKAILKFEKVDVSKEDGDNKEGEGGDA